MIFQNTVKSEPFLRKMSYRFLIGKTFSGNSSSHLTIRSSSVLRFSKTRFYHGCFIIRLLESQPFTSLSKDMQHLPMFPEFWNLFLYREHVVWGDKDLRLKLLRNGILTRKYTPMKNYDHLPKETHFGLYREATRGNPNYFLTYGNEKEAARVQDELRPNGAH
ncbi:hypothetical protein ES288_A12G166100v1 [Gossypium darwinii]|uniref:Uncharacterized protein n=1 Tax=Gossypium darwinii TaxID=34276 RepID=A0A5D2E9R2_GOSDA|nr:hypothetical protein ES288_A12G166100v1 [Gossypium darwinii]